MSIIDAGPNSLAEEAEAAWAALGESALCRRAGA